MDSERRFAVILEDDNAVLKWFKPARGQFQIYYHKDQAYEPDFVVELRAAGQTDANRFGETNSMENGTCRLAAKTTVAASAARPVE